MNQTRRTFLKNAGLSSAAAAALFSARSYARIIGANDRIRVAVAGVNSRGDSLARTFAGQKPAEVIYICDVDERAVAKTIKTVVDCGQPAPKGLVDFREALKDDSLDALVIAMPDHWHAPAAILGCAADKHVYVEKPLSHNPHEGELVVKAAREHRRVVQMGTQRRSSPTLAQGMDELKNGVIGRVYYARAWYTNKRPTIGVGKQVPVPSWLNYELWQGPAPRRPFVDNLVHYDWHWRWHWGTGEALNNGTHYIDIIRWGLGVDFPLRVCSVGGRYHFTDDWETPDTQIIGFDFPGNKSALWESRSCNAKPMDGESSGITFFGEKGSFFTGGNDYTIYDLDGKTVRQVKAGEKVNAQNAANPSPDLDTLHIANFLESIRDNKLPSADVEIGHKSTLLVQLGNIAWRTQRLLHIDPANGHIASDAQAQKLWGREYEKGWEPVV